VKGIRHRLLRSVLTLAVVVLAVAFFMFLLSESMFMRSTGRGVADEIEQRRLGSQTMTKLFVKPTDPVLVRRFSRTVRRGDDAALAEAAAVAGEGWTVERVAALARLADREKLYGDFLSAIPTGKRMALIQKREGRAALEYIRDNRQTFRAEIAPMVDLRIPGRIEGLEAFLDAYDGYLTELASFAAAWNRKVDAAVDVLERHKADDERNDAAWLSRAPAETVEAWRKDTVALGFALAPETLGTVREQIDQALVRTDLLARLNTAELRALWTQAFRERKRTSSDEKLLQLDDARAVPLFKDLYDVGTLRDAARQGAYERRLGRLERRLQLSSEEIQTGGLSGRQVFLLCISFLVCMVGIANAMLMSITERFREIATMKCLGATDRYILLQFMMEAALQGICGGTLGVLIGFLIAFVRSVLALGGHLFSYWPALDLLACGFFSLTVGVLLAVLASIHPSWSASRMAPMEAMRIE
jgi:hypothetical protein